MQEQKQRLVHEISRLMADGRPAESRAELDNLLALDGEDPESRSLAGDVYSWTGAHAAAYRQYSLAAETWNKQGRADLALAVSHKILDLDTNLLDSATQTRVRLLALLVRAEDNVALERFEEAATAYQEAIRQFPNHTVTYQRLANLLARMGRVDDAVTQVLTVARAFYQHGVHAKARPYFERALEFAPDHPEALDGMLACLKAEGREEDAPRLLKAGVAMLLEKGEQERAEILSQRLGAAFTHEDSPLRAALLLQSGAVETAERVAATLDLNRPELAAWFKRLSRAALDRADANAAQVYTRWASGQTELAAPPAPVPAPAPAPAPAPETGSLVEAQDERAILVTMGDMCLSEEMFEEARQVFERLLKSEPRNPRFIEQLDRARAGLGLGPAGSAPATVIPPAGLGAPGPPPPSAPAPVPVAPPVPTPAPAPAPVVVAPVSIPVAAPPISIPVAKSVPAPMLTAAVDDPQIEPLAERVTHSIEAPAMQRPVIEWDVPAPQPIVAAAPPFAPVPAVVTPPAPVPIQAPAPTPAPVAQAPVRDIVTEVAQRFSREAQARLAEGAAKILRTGYTAQLGELQPFMPSSVELADDLIE